MALHINQPSGKEIPEGTADPRGNVTGIGGDLYRRVDGSASSLFVHIGTSSNNTDWVSMRGNSSLLFTARSIRETGAKTDFLLPGGQDASAITTESRVLFALPRAGILANLQLRHNVTSQTSVTITYTVRIVFTGDTALTVNLNADQTNAQNTSDFVVVNAGDRISVSASHSITLATPTHIHASLSYF